MSLLHAVRCSLRVWTMLVIGAAVAAAVDGHASLADKCGVHKPLEHLPWSLESQAATTVKRMLSEQRVPCCKPAEDVMGYMTAFALPGARWRHNRMGAGMGRSAAVCQQRSPQRRILPSVLTLRARDSEPDGSSAFDRADIDLLRKRMSKVKEDSIAIPGPELTPEEVITQTLKSLQNIDDPYFDAGVEVLLRLASDRFKLQLRWLVGSSQKPGVLSSVFRNENTQFHLLLCAHEHHFPFDTYHIDDHRVFVDCQIDAPQSGSGDAKGRKWTGMMAKLGFEMIRDDGGVWLFDSIIWHDFRDGFRPGIGQEEWPRICG
eukprot:2569920-Rhodomonas_salina.2